jgi:hypothetical protein
MVNQLTPQDYFAYNQSPNAAESLIAAIHPPLTIDTVKQSIEDVSKFFTSDNQVMEGVELMVSYTVSTISAKAQSFDAKYQLTRTERFETIVLREILRNPTKLRNKLLVQARNHFTHWYRASSYDQVIALPGSLQIATVKLIGLKKYPA